VFIFVFLDQDPNNLHERGERVRLVLADFIDQTIKYRDQPPILFIRMGYEYRAS
jgi:hypothetical protein